MVNLLFPSNGLLRSKKHHQRPTTSAESSSTEPEPEPEPAPVPQKQQQFLIGPPPSFGGPWVLSRDQHGQLLWSNPTTGNWVYPGASSTMPTLPPHMMYVPQAPQQPIWHVPADATNRQMPLMPVGTSPVAASASSGKKESGTEKSRSRTMWPVPVWEERHVGEGKMAWIHKETRQVVYDDPYM